MDQENKIEIAARHRDALRKFMKSRGLNVLSWTKKANLRESTLRNFLNEASDSITSKTLFDLAHAENSTISEILGEEFAKPHSDTFNTALLSRVMDIVREEAKAANISFDSIQEAQAISHLYEIAVIDGKNGERTDLEKEAASILRFMKRQSE